MDLYAQQLVDAVDAVVAAWVERCVVVGLQRAGREAGPEARRAAAAAGEAARAEVVARMRSVLEMDVDAQTTTPLAILRRAVAHPTRVLHDAGVPPVERDRFSCEVFPDDVYDLTPANVAAVDPSLAEVGLAWGASKAMAHLRRHRPVDPAG